MRIAVVDDETMFQKQLEMMIRKVSENKEVSLEVDCFSSGEDFINNLSNVRYDVVFMDIFMPQMDGIATATKLREMTERTFLIFLTASEGHYPDAFALHAFDYVTKPFNLDRIMQVMEEIFAHTPMDEAFVKFALGGLNRKVYLKNIISVTTDGHYLDVFLEEDSIRVRMTANQFLEMVNNDERFLMANRGIIVNMEHIVSSTDEEIEMSDESRYPISVKKAAQIISKIHDYTFKKSV